MRAPHLSRRVATVAVLAVLVLAVIAYFRRPAVVEVDTAFATRGPMRETVDEDAKTRVRDRFVIAAPVAGHLRRLTVREGSAVRPGQIVGWIEPLPLDETARRQAAARVSAAEAAISEAAARVSQAEVAAAQAHRTLDRAEALLAAGAISPERHEQAALDARARDEELVAAQSRARSAASDLESARATLLAVAPTRVASVAITSPASGRVLRIPEISERVTSAGAPILEVGDASALEIVADVLSTEAVRVRAGQDVDIVAWGGDHPLRACVRSIEPSAFTRVSALGIEEQRVNVIIDFREPVPMLGDGFRVEVRIIVWEAPDVLMVPASAVVQNSDSTWSVFVVEGGRARRRDVKIGHRGSGSDEVLDGITRGAEVILFPSDQVQNGVRVRKRTA